MEESIENRPSTSNTTLGSQSEIKEDLSKCPDNNRGLPSWIDNEKHKTGNAKNSFHGYDYQLKLLMLFACASKNCAVKFRLASEMTDADKFDDLVFRYEKNGKILYRFLQAKHCHTEDTENKDESDNTDNKIKIIDLLSKSYKNDYSLKKYFVSFINIKNNETFKDGYIQDLIICTNGKFDFIPTEQEQKCKSYKKYLTEEKIKWRSYLDESNDEDHILNLGGKRYQFSKTTSTREQIRNELKPLFEIGLEENELSNDQIDENINEFLDRLVFAVDQPSRASLEEKIKEKLSKEFNLISDIIYKDFFNFMSKWMQDFKKDKKQHYAHYLTQNDLKQFFNDAKTQMHTDFSTLFQIEKFKKYGTKFDDEIKELKIIQEFLESTEKQVLIIYYRNVLLSEIKVLQILQMDNIKLNYIFSNLETLSDQIGSITDPKESFQKRARDLLIISQNTETNIKEVIKPYFNLLIQNYKKKIILITSEKQKINTDKVLNDLCNELSIDKCKKCLELTDNKNALTDLTSESQEYLLEKSTVIFQGSEVCLRTLINESRELISGDVLFNIINNNNIVIGKELKDCKYNSIRDYYIERKISRYVIVKKKIEKENKFFVIKNHKEPDSNPEENQDILLISTEQKDFMKLCHKYKKHNIHRVQMGEDTFVWQQSRGNLSKLREFIIKSDQNTSLHEWDPITRINDKEVIISADPGMGKSMLLVHLALQAKESDRTLWISKVNLVDYSSELENQVIFNEEEEVMKFLYRIVGLKCFLKKDSETKEEFKDRIENFLNSFNVNNNQITIEDNQRKIDDLSLLEVELFYKFYKEGKVILLFDGFDEISPCYEQKVKELLKFLKDTQVKIWITTRPYNIQDDLENELGEFTYSLKPLTEDKQKDYLKKFWKIQVDDERSEIFINELISLFSKSTKDIERNFVSIPLQIHMFAVIFRNIFSEWYKSGEECLSLKFEEELRELMTLNSLYEKFIKFKFDEIWIKEKHAEDNIDKPSTKKRIDKEYQECLEYHRTLAAYSILREGEFNLFLSEEELNELIPEKIEEIKHGEEKIGIITQVVDNKPIFVHRTFAEYFLFDFIYKKLLTRLVENNKIWEFILGQIFIKGEYYVVRRFFNSLLAADDSLLIRLKNNPNQSAYIKNKLKEMANVTNTSLDGLFPPIPLHVASKEGSSAILNLLLENQPEPFNNARNSMVKMSIQSKYLSSHEPSCRKYGCYVMNRINNFVNVRGYGEYKTALDYAIKNGHVDIVRRLLDNGAYVLLGFDGLNFGLAGIETFEILLEHFECNGLKEWFMNCKGRYNESLLHYAVIIKNYQFIKLLLDKKINIHDKDIEGKTPLHLAAEYGNEKIIVALIDEGADVNCKDNEENTPLHLAIMVKKVANFHTLTDKGADVNCRNNEGNTTLHLAAMYAGKATIATLINKGADTNCRNNEGNTP